MSAITSAQPVDDYSETGGLFDRLSIRLSSIEDFFNWNTWFTAPPSPPAANEIVVDSYGDVWNSSVTFLGWGLADYYDKPYVRADIVGERDWIQEVHADGSRITQTTRINGNITLYSIGGEITTEKFTAYERIIDDGADAGQQEDHNGAPCYIVTMSNETSRNAIESYDYRWTIEGIFEYRLVVRDGELLKNGYEIAANDESLFDRILAKLFKPIDDYVENIIHSLILGEDEANLIEFFDPNQKEQFLYQRLLGIFS